MPKEIDFLTEVWIVQMEYDSTILGVFTDESKARAKATELNDGLDHEVYRAYRFTVQ